jgi:hypothetical protein
MVIFYGLGHLHDAVQLNLVNCTQYTHPGLCLIEKGIVSSRLLTGLSMLGLILFLFWYCHNRIKKEDLKESDKKQE